MPVKFTSRLSPELCRQHPDDMFLFGDNFVHRGTGGQARIRHEPNSHGVRTKVRPSMEADAFLSDNDFSSNATLIAQDFALPFLWLFDGKTVWLPKAGLGTGMARLPEKAPRTYAYLAASCSALVDFAYRLERT